MIYEDVTKTREMCMDIGCLEFALRLGRGAAIGCTGHPPQGLEFALTLSRGAALDVHWTSIHYRTRSSPYRDIHKGKEMPNGISFSLVPPQGLEPWTP